MGLYSFKEGKRLCFPFLVIFLLISFFANSQSKEIGFGLASFNYTGDINPLYSVQNQTLGGYIHYNKSLNDGWVAKLMLAGGKIKGSDAVSKRQLSSVRSAAFNDFITEASFQMQYEFLDFRNDRALVNFTPYVGVGAGFLLINRANKIRDYSDIQLMLPLSLGIKVLLSPVWTVNFEFSTRKTFYDYLDNISEEEITDKRNTNFQFGNWGDNDWYYFIGVGVSYVFWQVDCPVPLAK
ncbi:MAG: hypothetical protein ACJAT1_000089 [Marivirga sp.]|jgi:hypothetical protein